VPVQPSTVTVNADEPLSEIERLAVAELPVFFSVNTWVPDAAKANEDGVNAIDGVCDACPAVAVKPLAPRTRANSATAARARECARDRATRRSRRNVPYPICYRPFRELALDTGNLAPRRRSALG
jgi:hypothetical protein